MNGITKEQALAEMRKYPDGSPEIVAMALMRSVDSWDEHRAIIAALDEYLATPKS